jgi:penicillin amidase
MAYHNAMDNTVLHRMILLVAGLTITLAASTTRAADTPVIPDTPGTPGLPSDHTFTIAGLSAPVEILLDELRVPSIRAATFDDAVRAQGFVHAQERFFQMDAGRRMAAGELAELAPQLITFDRQYRPYRFRAVAEQVLERLDAKQVRWLHAYAEGVNAGLEQMTAMPMEYAMLGIKPQPWKPEDSILVFLMMFDFLHMEASFERRLGVLRDSVPKEIFTFLTPNATRFDVPLLLDGHNDWQPMDIPGPDVIDLRSRAAMEIDAPDDLNDLIGLPLSVPGSNNWAVAGSRTTDGRAIIANDPHLQLSAPGIWYRAHLQWGQGDDTRMIVGVSLPGTPSIVIGSNGHVAWGFTNTMGDFQDLIIIEVNPENPDEYRTPDGYEPFEIITERINVRGRGWQNVQLRKTRWGIVTDEDHLGRPLVLKWTALDPDLVDMNIIHMAFADTLDDGVEIARHWGGPSQNIVMADDTGRIAWVVSGHFPNRFGFDGRYPVSWANGDVGWDGMIDPYDKPAIIDPVDGMLYTANNRTVSIDHAHQLGGIWTAGERANRIHQLLQQKKLLTEDDLFAMQLDTRLEKFDFYRDLAIDIIENSQRASDLFDDAHDILVNWNGTADADQPAVRILQTFRHRLHTSSLWPLVSPARSTEESFFFRWFMDEEPVRRLLETQPAHLLPPQASSWDDLMQQALDNALSAIAFRDPANLHTPWGELNRTLIQHPLAMAIPAMAQHLNLPDRPQPGHVYAVRVASRSFGASARLVVSPGREADGILHIPAGQSGHPNSPHYAAGHDAWLAGKPLPLLPGQAAGRLTLQPLEAGADDEK